MAFASLEITQTNCVSLYFPLHPLVQELALLCINSIQRDLKDPNARTRANALRTITSIRVPMVVHLVVMALRSAVKDGSPFVRKIAAHALPKVVRTDVEQEGAAVEMVASLLGDREPMVLASAVVAFDQVCPQRLDLLHAHFRKLCHLLADLDEWGQIKCVGVLLHYGRTHFTTPFSEAATHAASIPEKDRKFYSDSEDSDDEKRGAKAAAKAAAKSNEMDPDHALLLRSVQVLFRSQNSGVVLAAAALFQALAPVKDCCAVMGKALVHACRAHPEMQYCVLSAINAIAAKPGGYARMFAPYLKSFYVLAADPFYVRELKLDIMASLASELNMTSILREFQAYCRDADKTFVGAAIQAIGRCALNVPEVAQACMRGLMVWRDNGLSMCFAIHV